MISRNDADAIRPAQNLGGGQGLRELNLMAHVHQITGQGNVVRGLCHDIRHNRGQNIHVVNRCPCAMPVKGAGEPFVQKLAKRDLGQWPDMRV